MKFKLIYQQMLGFFTVIILLLICLAFSLFHLTKQMVYQDTWDRLEGYAYSLKSEAMTLQVTDSGSEFVLDVTKLRNSEVILQNQNVHFTIYTAPDKILYPSYGFKSVISNSDWKKLKQGQILKRKSDLGGRKKLLAKDQDNQNDMIPDTVTKQRMTDIFAPCFDPNGKLIAVISVGATVSSLEESFQTIRRNLVYTLVVSAILGIIGSYVLAHYTTKRIAVLRNATKQVAEGNFDITLKTGQRDEIDDLATSFNKMTTSLKESNEEIKRQEERRRQFMADAAHEMRTPLTTINGLLEGLAYDAIPEERKGQCIELMQNETKRLIRLVNENLDYEKIRSGQIVLSKTTFNAVDAIKNVVAQLDKKAQTANDTFELDIPAEISVYADYDRFVQILLNITKNAIQFTNDGVIKITAKRQDDATEIQISDTGIGMTEEQIKNIWERYYKADVSRKNTKYGESGLGLAIVHQLMQLHQGKIEVTSQLDQGSTFTLTFPDEKI
jgi:signal transduction histidine kinase